MKILVLGKGYIGNYIAKGNTSHDVVHLSKDDLDYSDTDLFRQFLHRSGIYPKPQFNWIVNCSGYTGRPNVDACESDKENCYHYNVTVPLYLTRIANQMHIPIIHIGSGCIYSGYGQHYNENVFSNFGADCPNSSFYSKTKDAFEKLSQCFNRFIFRIRIPFNGAVEPKNYIWKLLHYDNLISYPNSITNVDDLVSFTYKFMEKPPVNHMIGGTYNVTNKGAIEARTVVDMLKKHGLENPKWKFVPTSEANFKVERSNCILSTQKIEEQGYAMPPVEESMERAIAQYAASLNS